MYPDLDFLAFFALPVPVREQVQNWLRSPPGLVVIKVVLGETAHVHDAEVRIDARPAVGRRFAPIIEAGPRESSGQERPRIVEFPPEIGQCRPWWVLQIVRPDVALFLVVEINPAGRDGAGRFRAHHGERRVVLVELVDAALVVVEPLYVLYAGGALPTPAIVHGLSDGAGIVVGFHHALHGG